MAENNSSRRGEHTENGHFAAGRRRRPDKSHSRLSLALALLGVLALVGAAILGQLSRLDAAEAECLSLATPCTDEAATGCRQVVSATIERLYRSSTFWGPVEHVLVVRLADRRSLDLVDRGGGLYGRLRPGDAIQVQFWEGKAVLALGADGAEMVTQNDPGWQASDKRLGAFFFVFVGAGFLAMGLWLWRHPEARLTDDRHGRVI